MISVRDGLVIGRYAETLDIGALRSAGIGAMLQLAEPVEQPGIVSLYLPVEDGVALHPDNLRQGIDFVRAHNADGRRVLVACGAGVSRSPAFAVAALKEIEALPLLEVLRTVRGRHSDARIHPALWTSLCDFFQEDAPLRDAIRIMHFGR